MQEIDLYIGCSSGGYRAPLMRTVEAYWKVKGSAVKERRSSRGLLTRNLADLNAIGYLAKWLTAPCNLTIHTSSSYIFVAFGHMKKWEERGYKTSNGDYIEHADAIRFIYERLKTSKVRVFYNRDDDVDELERIANVKEKQALEREKIREMLNSLS
nr:MAG TPA: Ribonuclease H [Caudoviricetes sp.]